MYKILFVDDDERLLSGLKRMIHSHALSSEWKCVFCSDPQEAVVYVKSCKYDVVVSDMQMPILDGSEFLELVRINSPSAIRIVLSGHSNHSSLHKVIGPAHQYLAKPCSFDVLLDVIQKSLVLKDYFSHSVLRNWVGFVKTLPSPSESYRSLLDLLNSETVKISDISELIEKDIAMTAEILKMTNSQYFSVSQKITSVDQAIRFLGLDTIKSLVIGLSIFSSFQHDRRLSPFLSFLENRAVKRSLEAAKKASVLGGTEREIQMARICGMLTEVGVFLFLVNQSHSFLSFIFESLSRQMSLVQLENSNFGFNHFDLGAYLLGLWGFSDDVVWAIASLSPNFINSSSDSFLGNVLRKVYGSEGDLAYAFMKK